MRLAIVSTCWADGRARLPGARSIPPSSAPNPCETARRGAILKRAVVIRRQIAIWPKSHVSDGRGISEMTESKRPFAEKLELRITMRRVAEFFEALSKLDEPDKGMLFSEITKNLREYMPDAPIINPAAPTSPPKSFVDRCRELATLAPNDRIQNILLKIVDVYEVEAIVETVDNTITTSTDVLNRQAMTSGAQIQDRSDGVLSPQGPPDRCAPQSTISGDAAIIRTRRRVSISG